MEGQECRWLLELAVDLSLQPAAVPHGREGQQRQHRALAGGELQHRLLCRRG